MSQLYDGESDPRPFLDQNHEQTVILAPSSGLASLMRMLTVQGELEARI